jgi:hypothetical protein
MRHRWLRVSLFAMPTYNATINTGKQAVLLISRLQKALFFVSHGIILPKLSLFAKFPALNSFSYKE